MVSVVNFKDDNGWKMPTISVLMLDQAVCFV